MRILLVNKYFYRKGGAKTYFFELAEGLRALGHEVAFFSMRYPNNEPSYWSKYFVSEKDYVGKISAFQQAKEAATLIYSLESKRKFETLFEEFKPDIIHLNNVHRQLTLSILDAPYLKKHRVPVVYTAHDYILLCPAYTMVDDSGHVCDDCLDRHWRILSIVATLGPRERNTGINDWTFEGVTYATRGEMCRARRQRYLEHLESGMNFTQVARAVGVSKRTGKVWRNGRTRSTGRNEKPSVVWYPARMNRPRTISERYLGPDERLSIADWLRAGDTIRAIARRLGRSPSTISREVRRNSNPDTGRYEPYRAHERNMERLRRPKTPKVRANSELLRYVRDHLAR